MPVSYEGLRMLALILEQKLKPLMAGSSLRGTMMLCNLWPARQHQEASNLKQDVLKAQKGIPESGDACDN